MTPKDSSSQPTIRVWEADIFCPFMSVWVPVGPAVLLASERASAHLGGSSRRSAHGDPRRCGAQMMITASHCMLRTSLSPPLPPLLERHRRMLETESLPRQTLSLSYSLPFSLSLSLPPSLPMQPLSFTRRCRYQKRASLEGPCIPRVAAPIKQHFFFLLKALKIKFA